MDYSNFTGKMGSKDYLKYALFSLMEDKSIYKITVKELCDRAMINRSTFYDNYDNIEDFINQIMTELATGLVKAIETEGSAEEMLSNEELAVRMYTKWYQYVHDNYDAFRMLMGSTGTPVFREMLFKQGWDRYTALLKPITSRKDKNASLEILVNYIIGAHMGLLEYYVNSGMTFSPEYMAEQMVGITMSGPYSLLNRKYR